MFCIHGRDNTKKELKQKTTRREENLVVDKKTKKIDEPNDLEFWKKLAEYPFFRNVEISKSEDKTILFENLKNENDSRYIKLGWLIKEIIIEKNIFYLKPLFEFFICLVDYIQVVIDSKQQFGLNYYSKIEFKLILLELNDEGQWSFLSLERDLTSHKDSLSRGLCVDFDNLVEPFLLENSNIINFSSVFHDPKVKELIDNFSFKKLKNYYSKILRNTLLIIANYLNKTLDDVNLKETFKDFQIQCFEVLGNKDQSSLDDLKRQLQNLYLNLKFFDLISELEEERNNSSENEILILKKLSDSLKKKELNKLQGLLKKYKKKKLIIKYGSCKNNFKHKFSLINYYYGKGVIEYCINCYKKKIFSPDIK